MTSLLRVLVVDDAEEFLDQVHEYLSPEFFSAPSTASDSRAALELLGKHKFDVAIVDLHLPNSELQGLDLIREITHEQPRVAIVALTGDPQYLRTASQSIENGAVQFMKKLPNQTEFVERVRQAIWIKKQQNRALISEVSLLNQARQIQRGFMQIDPFRTQSHEVKYCCRMARSVTGDFVDFRVLPDNDILVIIGDSQGSGAPAALVAHAVVGCFRTLCETTHYDQLSPVYLFGIIAKVLSRHKVSDTQSRSTNVQVSLLVGRVNAKTGEFKYVRAGHEYPILLREAGYRVVAGDGHFPIGVSDSNGSLDGVQSEVMAIERGESLILYTDGLRKEVIRNNFEVQQPGTEGIEGDDSSHSDESILGVHDLIPIEELSSSLSLFSVDEGVPTVTYSLGDPDEIPHWMPNPVLEKKKLGKFQLRRVIGKGGMGIVFEGHDPSLDRKVAIKVIKSRFGSDHDYLAQRFFKREAKVLASIKDPNVVTIFHYGSEEGIDYIVMQYLNGESLREMLKREGSLALDESVRIAIEITSGLVAAHRNSIVHRDIKPENIFIDAESGMAIVIDFGVGKQVSDDDGISQKNAGARGTLRYMAPEQLLGEPTLDARADIYSLGCVLFEVLTGRRVFDQQVNDFKLSALICEGVSGDVFSADSDIPAELRELVVQMIQKNECDRPQSAIACLALLRKVQEQYAQTLSEKQSYGESLHFLATNAAELHSSKEDELPNKLFARINDDKRALTDDCTIVSIKRL